MKRINLLPGSPEWLAWRKGGIGSTDIAKIVGVSPYGTAIDVYNEKAGLTKDKQTNFAMERGKLYEPIVRQKFNAVYGQFEPDCFERLDYPYMRASLDGYQTGQVLEIKVPSLEVTEMAKQGRIPPHYYQQVQWQLFVADARIGWFVCYNPDADTMHIVEVERDEALIVEMKTVAITFWEDFLQGKPPTAQKKDIDYITDEQFTTIELAASKIKAELEKWEKQWEQVTDDIKRFGKGRSFRGDKVIAKLTSGRTTYDTAAMKEDGINMDKYAKKGPEFYTITIDKKA